ncbi:PREDICTED: lysophospholipid acyltransferase 5-like, partial [Amphimedon queenslandica]|uniref:Lysophospholipid acyltransferase 5 n=2 Tax=Amphimedon queenslandica TaxID=400682 RepID=A0AAN0JVN2_AMPQE
FSSYTVIVKFKFCHLENLEAISSYAISYIRYKHFISSILFDYKATPSSLLPGLQRLLLGILMAVIYSQFNKYFPLSVILSEEYQARSLLSKLFIMIITGKLALWCYMAVWTFAEATCVIMGISYNKSLSIPEYTNLTAVYNVNFWNNETSITLQVSDACAVVTYSSISTCTLDYKNKVVMYNKFVRTKASNQF